MNDLNITLNYSFRSGFGSMETYRYVREIIVDIINTDDSNNALKVGFAKFKMLYLDEAESDGYNLMEVLDTYEYTFRHAEDFFDFDLMDFKHSIYNHYNNEILSKNICMLERLEILPKYRGCHLGAKLIKDAIFHFGAGKVLFIVQAYPLQFEAKDDHPDNWTELMEIQRLEKNKKKAFKDLSDYYQSCGFEKIKGIKDLLFYNPIFTNKYFDAINLDA